MNNYQLNHNLTSFVQGEQNLSAQILISLRDKNSSVICCPTHIDINKRPLSFMLELDNSAPWEEFSYRIAKWQRNNKQESDIRAIDCSFEGNHVNMNFKKSGIQFKNASYDIHTQTKSVTFTMNHLSFSYTTDNNEQHTYYRLTEISNVLEGDLNGMDIREGKPIIYGYTRTFNLEGETFVLFYKTYKNVKRVFIETDGNIGKICSLLSFYVGAVIEWDLKITDKNGKRTIDLQEPYYKNQILKPYNEPLMYMVSNAECLDYLNTFQEGIVSNRTVMNEVLSQNIELYTRATLLDNRSRFLTYYVILERMVNDGECQDKELSQYLSDHNIDYDKLSCGIASKAIRNSKGELITNIRELRNEIVHHIGSSKIDKFLRDSEIITRMQYAACIIILWLLGFQDIQFIKTWDHLSVFNDNVEAYD